MVGDGRDVALAARRPQPALPQAAFVLDDWLDYGPRRTSGAGSFAERFDTASIDHWVFVSEYTRERARRTGLRSFALQRGQPTRASTPSSSTPAPPRAWAWRLLYVGRIDERKGIDTAVRALAHLPAEATLEVVGARRRRAERRLRALADWVA